MNLTNRLLLFLLVAFGSTTHAAQHNVLLLISDNQCWFDAGCYGNPIVKTPNIDALARRGVRFEHAFATTASCGPCRAVIYTGLLTHSNGQYAHPHREHNQQLRPDVQTVFSMLKSNGYRTALIGKDHIRPLKQYPLDFHSRRNSRDVVRMADEARSFFGEEKDKPFFAVLSFGDPHPTSIEGDGWGIQKQIEGYTTETYAPESVSVPPFLPDTPQVRRGIAGYYQQISRMDFGVGRVIEALQDSGRYDDTLIIFTSDHGTSEPGAMSTHYEAGVRVPFIVWHSQLGQSGLLKKQMVAFTDLTPTILDWTKTEFDKYPLHGRSILPTLESDSTTGWDDVLLSHVAHDFFAHYPMRTLRSRRYKLIWNILWRSEAPIPIDTIRRQTWLNHRNGEKLGVRRIDTLLSRPRFELYDLQNDPWETNNLAESSDQEIVALREKMTDEMVARLQRQGDPWLQKYHPRRENQRAALPK